MQLYVSAYNIWGSDEAERRTFVSELFTREWATGIELGYLDSLAWPAGAPAGLDALVSAVPGTTTHNAADPDFGLASTDPDGRERALVWARKMADDVKALVADGHPIRAVQLHSAPTGRAGRSEFLASLTELADLDWGGALLWIEHCDAWVEGQAPQKGYLTLGEELEILDELKAVRPDAGWGLVINWARSAIEGRSARTPLEHIKVARASGWLRHVGFSSCSDVATAFGVPWVDAHLPFAGTAHAPEGTQLDAELLGECLAACGEDVTLGLKLGLRPVDQAPQVLLELLDEHAKMVSDKVE